MTQLSNDTDLKYAQIDLSLFHVNSGILLQLWSGFIITFVADGSPQFTVPCSDGSARPPRRASHSPAQIALNRHPREAVNKYDLSGQGAQQNWRLGTDGGYMASKGMPLVPLFLIAAIVFEVGGGLSIALGYKAKLGAAALIAFLIPVSLIFHNFWTYEGMEQQVQMIMFMKNLAIMGGLAVLAGSDAGPLSLDDRKRTEIGR
jgi:putative oxidoreductase